jgi:galactonate dehydratase
VALLGSYNCGTLSISTDIAGKALGVPVYQLLGGKQRDRVPCFATANGNTAEEMLAEIKLLWDAGWTAIRTTTLQPPQPAPEIFEPRQSLSLMAETMRRICEESSVISLFVE